MGFQRAAICGGQFEARVAFIFQNYSNSFLKARLEARGIKAVKKQMVWLQNDGLLGFLFKSIVSHSASNGLLFVEDHLKPVSFYFSPLQQLFCESPSRSPWYLNSDRNTNILSPKRQASGLPIQIYCLIMSFQRASFCGRPSEVRVSSIFQAYSNPFVKARGEAHGI